MHGEAKGLRPPFWQRGEGCGLGYAAGAATSGDLRHQQILAQLLLQSLPQGRCGPLFILYNRAWTARCDVQLDGEGQPASSAGQPCNNAFYMRVQQVGEEIGDND